MGYNGGCHALFSLCLLFPSLVSHAVFLSTPYIPPAQVYVPDALFAMRANPAMAHRLYMQTDRAVRDIDANLALLLHAFLRPGGAEEAAKTARMSAEITAGREDAMAALSAGFGTASPLLSDAETEALVAHIRSIGGIGGPIQWYRLESGTVENFKDVPREIHVPVLFVGAEFQPLSAEAQRVRMRQLCPDLAEVVLQGAGSWIALERPEEVADIVGSWLYSRS
ncbi:Alpha/Beta hydrolase protein [Hyaloraphidium curvatum]|nr:Alpha/Beta hydrolase protein [Hyaloraphidium curvatum]